MDERQGEATKRMEEGKEDNMKREMKKKHTGDGSIVELKLWDRINEAMKGDQKMGE